MYVMLGSDADPLCLLVDEHLQRRSYHTRIVATPFVESPISWYLSSTGDVFDDPYVRRLEGVLVRGHGVVQAFDGWQSDDLAYQQTELQAALLGWLQALPCRVVGRPSADTWFRPERSLLEWHNLFAAHQLPVRAAHHTNDPAAAHAPEAEYRPLASSRGYRIAGDQWSELANLMALMPVTLLPLLPAPPRYAAIVGDAVFWSDQPAVALNQRLVTLAQSLNADMLEVEVRETADGPVCLRAGFSLHPERYDLLTQRGIAAEVCDLLTALHPKRRFA